MAFMKDILTHNIPIWEECAATPFVQEVQTGKLPLEKFKRYMIQDTLPFFPHLEPRFAGNRITLSTCLPAMRKNP